MNKEQIVEKLLPIVRDVFGDKELIITDSMSADTVDGWTSLSFMQLLARIEESFGFKFKIFDLVSIQNMGDLLAAIANKL